MLLGLAHHAVDVLLGQGRTAGDRHRLLLAGATILRGDVNDAVRVDVEGNLDLRHATGGRGDAGQLEGAEQLVVTGELTLALVDLDEHGGLAVLGGGEDLRGLGRDGRVAIDELGHNATLGLDTERQRGHVDEQDVLAVTLDDAGLQGGAHGDDLIGVDALVGLATAGQLLDDLGDGGHTGGAADEHDVVDLGDGHAGLSHDIAEGLLGALEQVGGELLELGARQGLIQVDGAVGGHGQVLQGDVRGGRGGQFLLRLLGGFLEALEGDRVLGQVGAGLGLDLVDQPVDDALIPVVAAQVVVAGGGAHLDGGEAVVILAHLEEGHVEGAATEVEDQDELVFLALFEAVGQGRGGGLVDEALDLQAGDLTGVLGGLALSVVEVGGDGDDGLGDGLAQVGLGVSLQLHEDARGDFLRGVLLTVNLRRPVGAHVALDGGDGAVNVGDGLALGDLANQDLTGLGEGDDRGGRASAFSVGDDSGLAAFEDGDSGVGGTEVDADCTCHGCCPFVRSAVSASGAARVGLCGLCGAGRVPTHP